MAQRILLFTLLALLSGCRVIAFSGPLSLGPTEHLKLAEEYEKENRYQDAIAEYRYHIDSRLAARKKPSWENPYFYLLKIGDIYLQLGDTSSALTSYLEAEQNQVEPELVSDRLRRIARWYEDRQEYDKAIEILITYKDRDPLLFELILDHVAKKAVMEDEHGSKESSR